MYELYQEQELNTTKDEIWKFISHPSNLNNITPPEMDFTIISEVPEKMYSGLLIQYNVKLPLLGTSEWVTEIKHIKHQKQFVDEQRIGPYKLWYHFHGLEELEGGVKMIDHVRYVPPYGVLGKMVNSLMIRSKLREIFNYRREILEERYNH